MASNARAHLVIHLVEGGVERRAADAFIRAQASRRYACEPPTRLPEILFAAHRDGGIVGTIGLDFGCETTTLPLESTWAFDRTRTPVPFIRSRIAQYGRWFAASGIAMPLLAAATRYALDRTRAYVLLEARRGVARHIGRFGCKLLSVPGARLLLESIPREGRGYYVTEAPILYMQELNAVLRAAEAAASSVRPDHQGGGSTTPRHEVPPTDCA